MLGRSCNTLLAELDSHAGRGGGGGGGGRQAGRLSGPVGAGSPLVPHGWRAAFPGTGDGCWYRVQLSEGLGGSVQLSGREGQLLVSDRALEAAARRLRGEEAAEALPRLRCPEGVGQSCAPHGVWEPGCMWELWARRALCRKWGAPHPSGGALLP